MKLYKDRKKDLHIVFIDLEKAYDKVPHEVLWECLEEKRVLGTYIQVIKDIHKGVGPQQVTRSTSLLMSSREGSITRSLGACADDIVLIDETKDGLNDKSPWNLGDLD